MTFYDLSIYTMTTPYWSYVVPNSTFYRILRGFHRTFATGVACRQETLTPPDTWLRPFGTCMCSTFWDPYFFPNLSLFLRTMLFEYPSALCRFSSSLSLKSTVQKLVTGCNPNDLDIWTDWCHTTQKITDRKQVVCRVVVHNYAEVVNVVFGPFFTMVSWIGMILYTIILTQGCVSNLN